MELTFRPLRADEVELRVSTCNENGFSLLLYKDARCDQNILDETVGAMNWKKSYQLIDGQLFCTIEIWDPDKEQWIGKQDVGVESYTEAEKGRASDAQKRSAFAFGIGRELYTAPFIWIQGNTEQKNGRYVPVKNLDRKLRIAQLETTNGVIKKLVIKQNNGKAVFSYGTEAVEQHDAAWEDAKKRLLELIEAKGKTVDEILATARVGSIDQLTIDRLESAIVWLAGQ